MAAKTTTEMTDAIARAHAGVKRAKDDLAEFITKHTCESFGNAMRTGGAKQSDADEYAAALDRTISQLKDALTDALRDLGSAEHIVSYGVAKTPTRSGRKSLVLY